MPRYISGLARCHFVWLGYGYRHGLGSSTCIQALTINSIVLLVRRRLSQSHVWWGIGGVWGGGGAEGTIEVFR